MSPRSTPSHGPLVWLLPVQVALLVATTWLDAGVGQSSALLLCAVLGGLAFGRGASFARDASTTSLLAGGALLLAVALTGPPTLSSDLHDGLARGRIAAEYGANPYALPPAQYPEDPFVRAAAAHHRGLDHPESPLLVALHTALCGLTGDRLEVATYLWKTILALAHGIASLLVYRAATITGSPANARRALYLYLWNPWVLLAVAGQGQAAGGLAALGVAAAVWACVAGRMAVATSALGLAALADPRAAVLLPAFLALAARRRRFAAGLLGLVPGLLVATALGGAYLLEPGAAAQLISATLDRSPEASLQALLVLLAPAASGRLLLAAGGAVALTALLLRLPAARDEASTGRVAIGAALMFLLLVEPAFAPWQHLSWLPLIALCPGIGRTLIAVAGLGLLALAIPHPAWIWATGLAGIAAVTATAPRP